MQAVPSWLHNMAACVIHAMVHSPVHIPFLSWNWSSECPQQVLASLLLRWQCLLLSGCPDFEVNQWAAHLCKLHQFNMLHSRLIIFVGYHNEGSSC